MKEKQVMSVDEMLNHLGKQTGITKALLKPCWVCEGKQYLSVLDELGEGIDRIECPNCHPAYA